MWICDFVKNETKATYQAMVVLSIVGSSCWFDMRGFPKHCQLNPVSCQ